MGDFLQGGPADEGVVADEAADVAVGGDPGDGGVDEAVGRRVRSERRAEEKEKSDGGKRLTRRLKGMQEYVPGKECDKFLEIPGICKHDIGDVLDDGAVRRFVHLGGGVEEAVDRDAGVRVDAADSM